MSDTWTGRLSEYLDEELSVPEQRALETHLEECAGCRKALEELKRSGFNTVILDIGLPDINGLILYREIMEKYPELTSKVIFLTGLPFLEKAVRKLADLGVVCLSKPVDQSTLAGTLKIVAGGTG